MSKIVLTVEQGTPEAPAPGQMHLYLKPTGLHFQTEEGTEQLFAEKGDKGDRGDPGIGIKGDTGDKGDKGDQGDPGVGIPEGGEAGQVVRKNSNAPGDQAWGYVQTEEVEGLGEVLSGKIGATGMPVDPMGNYTATIDYDEVTRTLSIVPVNGTDFDVYVQGVRYNFEGTQSIQHPDTYGGFHIYFDETGTLTCSETVWKLLMHAPVCMVRHNPVSGSLPFFEMHHAGRDIYWHMRTHQVEGTQVVSGFGLTGYTLDVGDTASVTFSLSSGVLADEDIRITTTATPDGGPYTILERSGASGEWGWVAGYPTPVIAGAAFPEANTWNGASWVRQELADGEFMNYFVYGLTVMDGFPQTVLIPGQNVHTTEEAAHAESTDSLSWGPMPFAEFASLYRITVQADATATNTGKFKINKIDRLIGSKVLATPTGAHNHNGVYSPVGHTHPESDISALAQDLADLEQALDGKAATVHGHAIGDVTGLQLALDGKTSPEDVDARIQAVVGTAPANLDTLGEIGAQLANDEDAVAALIITVAGKAAAVHGHAISEVVGLQLALDGKAAAVHGHAISEVTGLQTALNAKMDGTRVVKRKTANQAVSVTGLTAITELLATLEVGATYAFEFNLVYQSAAGGTGIALSLNGPAAPTRLAYMKTTPTTATAATIATANAYNVTQASATTTAANADQFAKMEGVIVVGASAGDLQLTVGSESNGVAVTIMAGSSLIVEKVA